MAIARNALFAGCIAALGVLAGCMSAGPGGGGQVRAQPSGVEGEWIGTDGVAISTLRGGVFSSRSAETGEELTRGSYTFQDQTTISLNFFSMKSQQQLAAACLLVNPNQMNCTLAAGTRFALTRRFA